MKLHLVDDWKRSWRWASVRMAAGASLVLGYLFASPDIALSVLNSMPAELRAYLSPIVGITLFVLVTAARVVTKKKDCPPEAAAADGE